MLENPYEGAPDGEWLRGNLHAHTTESDGAESPASLVATYEQRGYDFLAISDHDTHTDPERLRRETDLVLVPAVEVSANGPDLLHVGASRPVAPDADRGAVLDAIGEEGVAVVPHPNWGSDGDHWPRERLAPLSGYAGVEVYNGVIERLEGPAHATDRWDELLAAGERVWGFANDDTHAAVDVERGWNVVRAAERTPEAVLDALAAGRFYPSTGVTIRSVTVEGGDLTVETADADRLQLRTDHGVLQRTVEGPAATFRLPDDLAHDDDPTYVRVDCLGRGGEAAWTQPLFVEDASHNA